MSGLMRYVSGLVDEWENIPVNIAVTGNAGSGKSSYINAMLGLTAESEGAAFVGVTETTMAPKSYKYPDNNNFLLWDLPGVGTPKFPRDGYLKKVEFKKYDFFLIMSCSRFTENDVWLAKEVRKAKKHFYFVRSKVDIDVESDKHDHPSSHSRDKVISIIRRHTMECLNKLWMTDCSVFCISTRNIKMFSDFDNLRNQLIQDAPELQKRAMPVMIRVLQALVEKNKR